MAQFQKTGANEPALTDLYFRRGGRRGPRRLAGRAAALQLRCALFPPSPHVHLPAGWALADTRYLRVMHPDPTKVTPKGARMMRTKRNNFYRRWREAENAGRRTAWRRLARRAGPAAVTAAAALLLGRSGFHTACLRRETAALTAWCETPENAAAYAQSEADRARAAAAAGGSGAARTTLDPAGQLPGPDRHGAGRAGRCASRCACAAAWLRRRSGTLTFSAVLPQVVDIPAYVRRLEGSALFAQVAYGGYEDGGGRLHAAAGLCAGRPGKRGAKEAAAMRLETACDRTGTKSCCTARGSRPPCCCTASLRCRPRCRPTPRRRANGGRRRTPRGRCRPRPVKPPPAKASGKSGRRGPVREAAAGRIPPAFQRGTGHPL